MVGAYGLDKELATFLGRPPLIGWRYCDFQCPLDLDHHEVVADPETRDAAIARLEQNNGWNPVRSPRTGAMARGILSTSIIREQVLELSLCRGTDDLREKVEYVNSTFEIKHPTTFRTMLMKQTRLPGESQNA